MRLAAVILAAVFALPATQSVLAAGPDQPESRGISKPILRPIPASPQAENYADELTDFGIAPRTTMQPDVASETPTTIPGARVVATADMIGLVGNRQSVLVDVLMGSRHQTVPGAIFLPGAGSAGTFVDEEISRKLGAVLKAATGGRMDAPVTFFCYGSRCWESYNASLRALRLGYRNVSWYRGGIAAWEAAGQPEAEPMNVAATEIRGVVRR